MIISRPIHVAATGIVSSLFMAESYSTVWTDHVLLTHSPFDGHLGCLHLGLPWAVLLWMCVQGLFEHLFSSLLGLYLGVELLSHVIILYVTYCTATKLFP